MKRRRRRSFAVGFTLLEMLLAVAIMAILATLLAIPVVSLISSTRLSGATDHVVGLLGYARQSAIALNHTVEVRFYKYTDSEAPAGGNRYQAVQIIQYSDSGQAVPLTKVQWLPPSIIFDSNSTLSPLLSLTKNFGPPVDPVLDPQISLPRIGTLYTCAAFRFMPTGVTNLAATSAWYITLHRKTDGDNLSAPPVNYATIQIDPTSGAVKVYRP